MGCYINPRNCTKEQWLYRNGMVWEETPEWGEQNSDEMLVCLMDNGIFTAAGVVYDHLEYQAFTAPGDPRPKTWFSVKRDLLQEVAPIAAYGA